MWSAEYAEAWTGVELEMVDKGGGDTSLTYLSGPKQFARVSSLATHAQQASVG
jgi:hypothetical protein